MSLLELPPSQSWDDELRDVEAGGISLLVCVCSRDKLYRVALLYFWFGLFKLRVGLFLLREIRLVSLKTFTYGRDFGWSFGLTV